MPPDGDERTTIDAMEAVQSADVRYRTLAENAVVGLYQTTIDGEVIWVNGSAARISGFESPKGMLDSISSIREMYLDPSQRDEFARKIAQGGSVTDFQYRIRRPDGSIIWLSETAHVMRDESGDPKGYEGSIVDITDRKLVDSAATAIYSELDPHLAMRSFAEVLRQAVPFSQLSLTMIQGDSYRRIVSVGDDTSRFPEGVSLPLVGNAVRKVIATHEPVSVSDTREGRFTNDDRLLAAGVRSYIILPLIQRGSTFCTFNVGFKEPNAPTESMVTLLTSITSAVAQGVSNILVFERQREAIERLEQLDRLKDDFVATVAHDMRAPLATVIGFADLLLQRWDRLDDEHRREGISSIRSSAGALADFATGILDAAALESGRLNVEIARFNLSEVLKRVKNDVGGFEAGRVKVDTSPKVEVVADERRTWQVLANLVSNALKFSPEDRSVDLKTAFRDGMVQVTVQDRGIGIRPDQRQNLFQKFTRLDTPALGNRPNGAGLGLYISRLLVELQGGEIWVESEPELGTAFHFTLPAATP